MSQSEHARRGGEVNVDYPTAEGLPHGVDLRLNPYCVNSDVCAWFDTTKLRGNPRAPSLAIERIACLLECETAV
jgi:hypothetical protein